MLNKGRGLISLSQIEGGDTLQLSLDELITYLKDLNIDQFRKVTDKIKETDLDPKIVELLRNNIPYDDTAVRNLISNLQSFKADKATVEADYRKKAVLININDLDEDLRSKVNAIVAGGYDDSEIRQQIQDILATKLSKLEAENLYRDKNVAIEKSDLGEDINNILDNWNAQDEEINDLKSSKADRTELTAYRPKNIAISKADLAIDVTQILDNIPPAYDDTHVLLVLQELRQTKADITSLALYVTQEEANNLYRLSSKAIELTDLSDALQLKLKNIPNNFDPVNELQVINEAITGLNDCKAEKSELQNYRKKIDLIGESDLSNEVVTKLNTAAQGYDDSVLRESIQNLQSQKLGIDVAATLYRSVNQLINEADLSAEVQLKLNNSAYDDSELRHRITGNETAINNLRNDKADKTQLEAYRLKETKILEEDLNSELAQKINAISEGYDDSEIKSQLQSLSNNKADKTELTKYRLADLPITEGELTEGLRDKINARVEKYDDSELRNKIAELETAVPEKLSKTEAVDLYRDKVTKIDETDLTEAVKTKLNKVVEPYNDTEVKASIANLNRELEGKLAKNDADVKYRKMTDKLAESDLSDEVKTKLNKTYREFDETKLNDYRLKADKIDIDDLDEDIQDILTSSNTNINKAEVIASLTLDKLLALPSTSIRVLTGSSLQFRRGLFVGQKEEDINSSYSPVMFNYGNITHMSDDTERNVKVRLSAIENGYNVNIISEVGNFTEGTHTLKLYSNGVSLHGLTNINESTVTVLAVNMTNSVRVVDMYLNDGTTTTKLNKANLSMNDLRKKPSGSTIEIPVQLPTNLNFFINGENKELTLVNLTNGYIKNQNSITVRLNNDKMVISLADFLTLNSGRTYQLVGPTYAVRDNTTTVVTTAAPTINFTFAEEVLEPSPEPPTNEDNNNEEYDIDYTFKLGAGVYKLDLTKQPDWNNAWVLEDTDIYGVADDCSDYTAEVQYLGTESSTATEGTRVRRNGVDADNSLPETPNGGYDFTGEGAALFLFNNASVTGQKYRLIKRKVTKK